MPLFIAPIVGMKHRPPAADVLETLSPGAFLIVERQPDNPHDPSACRVLLPGFSENGPYKALREEIISKQGSHPDSDFVASLTDPLHLGYVDASKTGIAARLAEAMDKEGLQQLPAELTFLPTGQPALHIEWISATGAAEPASSYGRLREQSVGVPGPAKGRTP